MQTGKLLQTFGIKASNRLDKANVISIEGAIACLESFYYAFNNKNIDVLRDVWYNNELAQLNNPLGGVIRGINPITELYNNIFQSNASVTVELQNIIYYHEINTIVFAGVEKGEFKKNDLTIPLTIRTTRCLGYIREQHRWYQLHHHGSIDDADLLKQYKEAVNNK